MYISINYLYPSFLSLFIPCCHDVQEFGAKKKCKWSTLNTFSVSYMKICNSESLLLVKDQPPSYEKLFYPSSWMAYNYHSTTVISTLIFNMSMFHIFPTMPYVPLSKLFYSISLLYLFISVNHHTYEMKST